jgi:hypothetical protein
VQGVGFRVRDVDRHGQELEAEFARALEAAEGGTAATARGGKVQGLKSWTKKGAGFAIPSFIRGNLRIRGSQFEATAFLAGTDGFDLTGGTLCGICWRLLYSHSHMEFQPRTQLAPNRRGRTLAQVPDRRGRTLAQVPVFRTIKQLARYLAPGRKVFSSGLE